jgi:hypothetical protein
MAIFDQRNQKVTNQYNVAGNLNFGSVQSKAELAAELRKLLSEVDKATQAGIVDAGVSIDIESHIKKAVIEIEKPEPKQKSILDHLEGAKALLDGVTSATGLITAIMEAAKIAGALFLWVILTSVDSK